ncbi:hypothetical protein NQ315_017407 [Exocentrus adspersus]|uniref:Transposase n=1 Tax=Exocentrus adspersus TaxID=1586481 RepID=A0AAV8VKE4_9CUCU|nr:hypothetical protein NQ315_017407 [Exocentrus adspersus]
MIYAKKEFNPSIIDFSNRISIVSKLSIVSGGVDVDLTSENPLQCVYFDETWMYSKESLKRTWQDDSIKSCRKGHESNGKRFSVFHPGTKHGFVENASLVFSTASKSADCHDSMNRQMYEKWVAEKLLPNLEVSSLAIMDNAPYHSDSALAEKGRGQKAKGPRTPGPYKTISFAPCAASLLFSQGDIIYAGNDKAKRYTFPDIISKTTV